MFARACALAAASLLFGGAMVTVTGCVPDKDKPADFLKPPETWNPKADDLTFGAKGIEAFNKMSEEEREAHLSALKGKPGSFKGQARFLRTSSLSSAIKDAEFGKFEFSASVDDPVLYEITIEYHLFANEDSSQGFPPGTYLQFTGTLADLAFHNESKPRKLEIRVKDVILERLGG